MAEIKSFLGTGWKFPPTFDKDTGNVELTSEENDIRESLQILLATKQGERVMLPDFGCNMTHLAFENIDNTLINHMKKMIEEAIYSYEPRINLEEIDVNLDGQLDGVLWITVEYTIRGTNTRTNIVYPFYLLEGTDVKI